VLMSDCPVVRCRLPDCSKLIFAESHRRPSARTICKRSPLDDWS